LTIRGSGREEALASFCLMVLLLFGGMMTAIAEAAPGPEQKSTWQYAIEWRLVRAGTATMKWEPEGAGFGGDLHIESTGLVSKLYRVNDDYHLRAGEGLCASTVNIHAEEGKRRRDTAITFANGKATYVERDLLKNAVVLSKETPVPACVHDYVAGLQRLRTQRIDLGQSAQVPLSDGKKSATVRVEAQEREEVSTPIGKVKTIRYEVHMFNDVLINKKARLYVWLSDDERRLPVQIRVRMQFLIGTIELKLEKQE
jgi:Protein of unknown function (DUF3108)